MKRVPSGELNQSQRSIAYREVNQERRKYPSRRDEAGDFNGAVDLTIRPTEGVQAFGILKEFGVIE